MVGSLGTLLGAKLDPSAEAQTLDEEATDREASAHSQDSALRDGSDRSSTSRDPQSEEERVGIEQTPEASPASAHHEISRPEQHSRGSFRAGATVLSALAAALTIVLITSSAAVAYDRLSQERVPPGVSVSGIPIGGLDLDEARGRLMSHLAEVSQRTLVATAAGKTFSFPLSEVGIQADVDAALASALEAGRSGGLPGRLGRWFGSRGSPVNVELDFGVSREDVEKRVVASIAGQVNKEPTEASIEEASDSIVFKPATPGVELETASAVEAIVSAAERLASGDDVGAVRLSTKEIPVPGGPAMTTAILVRVKEQKLYFYENAQLAGVYTVSTGTPQYPTPLGRFRVVQKLVNPSWTNPAPDGWGKDMPAYIPPGPDNPLGTRALQLNAPGILIHGTQNVRALGSPASHGCIRMKMSEIEALFPRVPVGTPVFIR